MTYLALGQKDKAQYALRQVTLAKDAPWVDVYLQRVFQPEIDAALAQAEGKPRSPKK